MIAKQSPIGVPHLPRPPSRTDGGGFLLVLWCFAVVGVVFLFAASNPAPILFLFATAFAAIMLLGLVLLVHPQNALLHAAIFVVVFNASYLPLFGMLSAIEGEPTGLYQFALGVRSAWYPSALAIFSWLLVNGSLQFKSRLVFPVLLCLIFLLFNTAVSAASATARLTYILNSFLPLILTIFCLGAICSLPGISRSTATILAAIIAVATVIATVYFLLLPSLYDIFRPDLASFMRSAGGSIPKGGYDTSWGTRFYEYEFNRFVGTFPDPIIAGYFLASSCFGMLVAGRRSLAIWLFFLLVISLSKGAWLFFAQAMFLYAIGRKSLKWMVPIGLAMCAVQIGLATVLDASNRMHLLGLEGGVMSILHSGVKSLLIGYGVGDGGNMARGALNPEWLGSGSESGLGVLAHQLGLVGLLLVGFLIVRFFMVASSQAKQPNSSDRDQYSILAVMAIFASLLINTPLQENCINSSLLSSVLLSAILIRSLAAHDSTCRPTQSSRPAIGAG